VINVDVNVDVNLDWCVVMSSEYELLTYKEIVDRLGIKMTSARQTVSRRGWRRVKQNDGTVKVHVPVAYLQRQSEVVVDAVDVNPVINVDVDMTVEIEKLKAENAYLHHRVADLENDRDAWKEIANKPWFKRIF